MSIIVNLKCKYVLNEIIFEVHTHVIGIYVICDVCMYRYDL